jgi:hypothetical protein
MTHRFILALSPVLIAAAPVAPDPVKLRTSVDTLVSFGTRHTASSATDPKRGIGAARNWAASEFAKLGLQIERPARPFDGPRAPQGVNVENVMAIQRGTGDPDHVIIIAAHIDSRVSDVMDATSDAPGANDDASGCALVLEAARLLHRQRFSATIVYALLSGEEQGLWGGKLLAETARARGWRVSAMLNNDIVGNTIGQDGRRVGRVVRVFSEGIGAADDINALKARRASGSEDDSPSRALAKAVADVAAANRQIGLNVFAVRRPDRFGRGGDHTPMLEAGYPAVRFSVGVENYDAQHQDLRTEKGRRFGDTADRMDFPYLARVTALNVAMLRRLGNAPPAPADVIAGGAVSTIMTLKWAAVPGAQKYRVHWRGADQTRWSNQRDVPSGTTQTSLPGIIVDDTFAGVSAIAADGGESLISFATLPPR